MLKKPDLSIIIVNYNTKDLLSQCLRSIGNYEIIVVDNGSSDNSVEMINSLINNSLINNKKIIKLIANQENLGYAKANNQGLKIAPGKYILFLNSDTVVPKKTIPKLLAYFDRHPEVGVVTPRLELRDGEIDPDCHRGFPTPWAAFCYFTGLEKLFPRSKIFGQYHQAWKDLNMIHEIDSCCGAFLLTRKKILEEIGGFDESYFFYGEDLDLCFRLKQKGWKVIYYPKVKAVHYKGASSGIRKETRDVMKVDKKMRLKVAKASTKAMEIFYKKHYQDQYPCWITKFIIFAIRLKGLFRYLKYFV